MRVTPLQILEGAERILALPEAWTRGAAARDAGGRAVRSIADTACCWCPVGACWKMLPQEPEMEPWAKIALAQSFVALREAIPKERSTECLSIFNDAATTRHADVLSVVRGAIDSLRATPESP